MEPHTPGHQVDAFAIAMNAAGIADAFRFLRVTDSDGDNRYHSIADECGGFVGVAEGIAHSAVVMDRFRLKVGESSDWGKDLPHLYIAWGAIAEALWNHWESGPPELVTERALIHLVMAKPEDEEDDDDQVLLSE